MSMLSLNPLTLLSLDVSTVLFVQAFLCLKGYPLVAVGEEPVGPFPWEP